MAVSPIASSASDSSLIQNYMNAQKDAAAKSSVPASTGTQTSISKVTGDFNTFLKILTTQLQNQDPTNATDPNQFTQELVQFSGIEQQINANSKLDKIVSALSTSGITPLLGYVGQTIEASSDGQIVVQNGTSAFTYTLPAMALNSKITITDSKGKTVATMDGATNMGTQKVTWDGKTTAGGKATDGAYKIKIEANDNEGKAIAIKDLHLIGKVTGLQTNATNGTTLSLGDVVVNSADISAVYSKAS